MEQSDKHDFSSEACEIFDDSFQSFSEENLCSSPNPEYDQQVIAHSTPIKSSSVHPEIFLSSDSESEKIEIFDESVDSGKHKI